VNSWRSVSSRWTCCRRSNSVHRFGLRSIVPKSKRSRSWRSGVLPPKHSPARMLQYSRYDRSCRATSRRRGRRARRRVSAVRSPARRPLRPRRLGRNTGSGVEALIEGDGEQIDEFLNALIANPPPLAHITALHVVERPSTDVSAFTIVASETTGGTQAIPADVALCGDCRRELYDPADRRYRHPSSTAPTAVRAIRSSRACPTTANARRCAGLPCARRAGVNTKIPAAGAFMPNRSLVRTAARD